MELIDSHCHLDRLDLTHYEGDLAKAIDNAQLQGVAQFVCVAVDLDSCATVCEIAERFANVFASVGLHPTEESAEILTVNKLIELAQHPKVVALGETGLDYYHQDTTPHLQQENFRTHIQAARQIKKPLIVHTRDAREDTIKILREEKAHEVGGVLHCFTENLDMALQAIDLGFYISFSGIITFKNAKELQAVAKQLPLEKMLIETDAPYLAPVPYRGKSNEPAYVRFVAEAIAALRDISVAEVAAMTTKNTRELFKLK